MPRGSVKSYKSIDAAMRAADRQVARRLRRGAYRKTSQGIRGRVSRGYTRSTGFYGRYPPLGSELKFFDTSFTFSVDTTGEVPATGQLCLIPQGVTESTRVGRKCIIKSLRLTLNIQVTPGALATASDTGVIYVMLDTQTNGAAASIADIFTTTTDITVALRNLNNVERFKILKILRYKYSPGAGATTAFNTETIHKECYLGNLNIPLEFSSTTGAITELKSNNIFICAGSHGLDDAAAVTGRARVRFSDM